ncbi:MAG: putative zinc protease [Phycisphaerales bacterium]|nr:insulinase family protein [Phycisphaerales bacterium]GIK20083.1 MAG: peptidase M16 [Planctomycetota bacterium]
MTASISTRMLACGMPLIVETIPGVRSAALAWLLPAGSATDPAHLEGRSTLVSELLLRGAGDLGSREQADAFDRLGVNRSTSVGTYSLTISATLLGNRLPEALPLIVDMVRRPRFDPTALEPVRDLALQSLDSLRDDPPERASILAKARHLPVPINRSGLGTEEGLGSCTIEDIAESWHALARPGRSILALAGAVDADAAARALDALLADWAGTTPEPVLGPPPPRGYAHEPDESSQVQVIVAHDAPPERDTNSTAERVVNAVLSAGMSSRLFTEVREKRGLCYSVSAGYTPARDHGIVSAYVGTMPDRAQHSLEVLLAEMRRINTPDGRITREEFDRAIVGMKSRLIFSGESTSARAGALATDYHKLGRARSLAEMAAEIDRLTLDGVNAYLSRRSLGRLTIQTLGPAPLVAPDGAA